MTNKKDVQADPKDGFDLIEYPCDYMFKAMCRASEDTDIEKYLGELVISKLNQKALLSTKTVSSRTGKFESVTLTVKLNSREELETVYEAIVSSPFVVMTL